MSEQTGITLLAIIKAIRPAGVLQVDVGELWVPITDLCDGTAGLYVSDDDVLDQGEEVAATEEIWPKWKHGEMKEEFLFPLQTWQRTSNGRRDRVATSE